MLSHGIEWIRSLCKFSNKGNVKHSQWGDVNLDKLYKEKPLLSKLKQKCNEITQKEHLSIYLTDKLSAGYSKWITMYK